jgi:S-formylglutathione hydrolase FrmB
MKTLGRISLSAAAVALLLIVGSSGLIAQRGGFPQARDVAPEGSRVEYKTFHSALLNRDLRYGLYLPPSYATSPNRKYPVLYFLHGLNENEMRWSSRGESDLQLDRAIAAGQIGEFIVAVPNGGTSFYTNLRNGTEPWEDMVVKEFVPLIESTTRVNATRATRGISGISMGGYGSLKIAFRHPEMFGSVSAHSAALIQDLNNPPPVVARRLDIFKALFDRIFGINQDLTYWDANNPFTLVKDPSRLQNIKIYLDCGTEDEYGFYEGQKALDDILTKAAYPHEAHLYPGMHGWDLTKQHIIQSMQFHSKAFGGKG